ncbi:hypothetical protein UCRPC4_g04074 [Phaeomoniella chlamydospora]|uniref:Velvet domain-containing protein n=1 Tax=Phaeomoniella chlamydospora TaxID=158046 RepID=A0A0G2ED06_PHACM|nr:hypothetical protein UCRPC4_g04074 [Phaeomoniella chlamydospora]
MNVPIVLAVKAAAMKENGVGPRGTGDMSGVWAFVSLATSDDNEVLAPPRTDLLIGRTAASVFAPGPRAEPNRQIVGYAQFSDLMITVPGKYRIRVSLIDMDTDGPSYSEGSQGGLNLCTITSDPIDVTASAPLQQPTTDETQLLERLRAHRVIS